MNGEYPWFKLRHRIKEIPVLLLVLFAGPEQRERLVRIINHRQEIRERIEGKKNEEAGGVHLHRD